ncbi:hypothetical protein F4780DRAFT_615595 [Xylariomycetidae sp. FL0641]|nr:hypothetical protein F4780DRAFT_615595 [Xylariomycetidae sp. FL0641]
MLVLTYGKSALGLFWLRFVWSCGRTARATAKVVNRGYGSGPSSCLRRDGPRSGVEESLRTSHGGSKHCIEHFQGQRRHTYDVPSFIIPVDSLKSGHEPSSLTDMIPTCLPALILDLILRTNPNRFYKFPPSLLLNSPKS